MIKSYSSPKRRSHRLLRGGVFASVGVLAGLWTAPALLALGPRLATAAAEAPRARTPAAESYPYGGERFTRFIRDSYRSSGSPAGVKDPAGNFYGFMDRHYRRGRRNAGDPAGRTLRDALRSGAAETAKSLSSPARAQLEAQYAAWAHRTVKRIVPRFCLDHGFEFWGAVEKGERQCLLQSVLLAGMLQAMRVDAGVVMVTRSPKGQESNNGHATTIVKLANGQDLLLDASAPNPFERHGGLMVTAPDEFRFVEPQYVGTNAFINGYRAQRDGETIPTARVRPLNAAFADSQFNYYRAERTPNGLLSPRPSFAGLALSESYMRQSVADCPGNPLAVYSLARVMNLQGRREEAKTHIATACAQYTRYGWLPPGPAALQASLQSTPEVASTANTGGSGGSAVASPMPASRPTR